ncbi:transposase [Streptomyces chryseus]|uniref:Transposase n=1 Tax=Streptomyces chryseus TaxID=68186 RepID=A0ABQ3EAY0_9ACTN|nr:hypothetical protein GCM10010346_64260 [Streptomyces chryseus]
MGCEQWPERRFAVEGAGGLGRTLAQQLAAAGEDVVNVPSTLSARARLLSTGGDRKTDPADALHVAQVALFRNHLRKVTAEDQSTILRLLTERRNDLVNERTRVVNRLHALLRDLLPGGAPTRLSADKAAALMKGIRPVTATDNCRRDLARDLLADLRRLDHQAKDNEAQMRDALAAARTSLTSLPGLGTVLAAKVLRHIGDISRFPTEHHFASYTGSAPLDAPSGKNVRHRPNTGGNRALNSALHIIAVCQIRDGGHGQEYYLRNLTISGGRRIGPEAMFMRTGGTMPCGLLGTPLSVHASGHGPSANRWIVLQRGASSSGMSGDAKWKGTRRWPVSARPASAAATPGGGPSDRR